MTVKQLWVKAAGQLFSEEPLEIAEACGVVDRWLEEDKADSFGGEERDAYNVGWNKMNEVLNQPS